jgi:hypothetical protein
MSMETTQTYTASCICKAIRVEAELDLSRGATRCNCTYCVRIGATGQILKPVALTVKGDESSFGQWVGPSRVATRYFCKGCGVHVYSRGHLEVLGGDFVSLNYNCLDEVDVSQLKIGHWDGRHDNWQAGMRDQPWPSL